MYMHIHRNLMYIYIHAHWCHTRQNRTQPWICPLSAWHMEESCSKLRWMARMVISRFSSSFFCSVTLLSSACMRLASSAASMFACAVRDIDPYLFVCMYICICVYMYICMYTYSYISICLYMIYICIRHILTYLSPACVQRREFRACFEHRAYIYIYIFICIRIYLWCTLEYMSYTWISIASMCLASSAARMFAYI